MRCGGVRIHVVIAISGVLASAARAEPALENLDGPHATAFDDTCARINDGRSEVDGLLACRRIAAARRVGPFARVEVHDAVFDAYVAVEVGADWYAGVAVPINGWSDSSHAEVLTIRRVVIRALELPGLGAVAALRFDLREAAYDFCSLRDETCRDHRRHLRSAQSYAVWRLCAVVDGVPACTRD